MFDQLEKNSAASSVNTKPLAPAAPVAPVRAEDIFAEVDKTAKPDVFRPSPDNTPPPRGTIIPPETGWKNNKMIVFSLLFGGLIIVVAGGYFGLRLATKSQPAANNAVVQEQPKNIEAETPLISPAAPVNETVAPSTQPLVTAPLDSDFDGLTDAEEVTFGTDPNNPDTDQDGLTDREEVKVYLTDSLKVDTDSDGFKDGDEVKNGYNPKGPGKLLQINQ